MKHSGTLLIVAGTMMLLFYPALWVYGKVSQLYLHRQWQQQVAAKTPGQAPRRVVGHLSIPNIYLDEIVVQGISDADLAVGPGHFPNTAMPGKGNCVIAGHLNINGSPFRDLDQLRPGDPVAIETDDHLVEYKVTHSQIINPDQLAVLKQTGPSRLELVTCMPGALRRLVVYCKQTKIE